MYRCALDAVRHWISVRAAHPAGLVMIRDRDLQRIDNRLGARSVDYPAPPSVICPRKQKTPHVLERIVARSILASKDYSTAQ